MCWIHPHRPAEKEISNEVGHSLEFRCFPWDHGMFPFPKGCTGPKTPWPRLIWTHFSWIAAGRISPYSAVKRPMQVPFLKLQMRRNLCRALKDPTRPACPSRLWNTPADRVLRRCMSWDLGRKVSCYAMQNLYYSYLQWCRISNFIIWIIYIWYMINIPLA